TNNLVARLDVPYHGHFLLRADVPHVWSNLNQPDAGNQNGLSDLFVRAGGRGCSGPGDGFFAGIGLQLPVGRWQVGDWLIHDRAWSRDGPRVLEAGLDFLHTAPAPSLGGRESISAGCRRVPYAGLVQHDLDRPMVDPARGSDSRGSGAKGIKRHDTGF